LKALEGLRKSITHLRVACLEAVIQPKYDAESLSSLLHAQLLFLPLHREDLTVTKFSMLCCVINTRPPKKNRGWVRERANRT
jgi:hypothetical protein